MTFDVPHPGVGGMFLVKVPCLESNLELCVVIHLHDKRQWVEKPSLDLLHLPTVLRFVFNVFIPCGQSFILYELLWYL